MMLWTLRQSIPVSLWPPEVCCGGEPGTSLPGSTHMWHLEEWVSLSLSAGMRVIRSSKLELLSGWGGQSKASSGREGMRCPLLGETGPSLGGERFATDDS